MRRDTRVQWSYSFSRWCVSIFIEVFPVRSHGVGSSSCRDTFGRIQRSRSHSYCSGGSQCSRCIYCLVTDATGVFWYLASAARDGRLNSARPGPFVVYQFSMKTSLFQSRGLCSSCWDHCGGVSSEQVTQPLTGVE